MKLIVCAHKGCINNLAKWDVTEILEDGTEIVECPDCGALHRMYESSNGTLYNELIPDNG